MTTPTITERNAQDEITRLFLAEIMSNLGVVAAGKIFNRVNKQVATEEDPAVREQFQAQINCLKALYIKNA